uniref:Profilin n=1 Tax=Hirondellea gigas TaxID=1518452 RepID=A0A2P2HWH8_9CRUS
MSWDAYISDQLLGTGNIKSAAICGLDGTTWASSENFIVTNEEALKLIGAFNDASGLASGGMHLSGVRYIYLSGTDEVLRAKKDKVGVHISKTKTAIIIALYEEPIQPGQCAMTVEALADYLKGVNY